MVIRNVVDSCCCTLPYEYSAFADAKVKYFEYQDTWTPQCQALLINNINNINNII